MSRVTQILTGSTDGASQPNENKIFYNKTLIKRLTPELMFYKYGQKKPLPKNSGNKVNFRKFNSLPLATSALTEGVTPDGRALDITKVEATVDQYGDFIEVSDVLDMLGIDPVITESADVLGEQGGQTIDRVIANVVTSGTTVRYAGGRAGRHALTSSDKLTGDEVKKAVRDLKKANAKPIADGFFIGIITPEQAYDLQSDTLWQDVSKYNGGLNIEKGEIGKIHGVRFVVSNNEGETMSELSFTSVSKSQGDSLEGLYARTGAGAPYTYTKCADDATAPSGGGTYYSDNGYRVFKCMIIGADAYGVVDVENSAEGKPSIIVKPHGSAGTADPLNQRATIGWKAMFTAVRLNELAMCRIETTATL